VEVVLAVNIALYRFEERMARIARIGRSECPNRSAVGQSLKWDEM